MKSIILIAVVLAVSCTYAANIGHILRSSVTACPEDDPLEFEGGAINITLDPLIIINEGSVAGPGVATGLSKLESDFSINLITTTVTFTVTLPSVHLKGGPYSATGVIDAKPFRPETIPSGPFRGAGSYEASATNFELEGRAVLLVNLINNRITIRILTVNTLKFGEVSVNLEGLVVDGKTIDWAAWNASFKANFDADWATAKPSIVETIRLSINQELRKYTLAQLIEIINRPPTTCAPRLQIKL